MAKLTDLMQEVRNEIGADYISTAVVNIKDGLSVAGESVDSRFDVVDASARLSMVVKLAVKVSEKTSLGVMEDTLTTTDNVYVVTRLLGDGSYFWNLAVTQNATLGMVRMIMKQYADQIWDAIPR